MRLTVPIWIGLCRSSTSTHNTEDTPPPQQPWILLPSVPAVAAASGLLQCGVPRRVPVNQPYISAVDPSGLLVCCSNYHTANPPRYFLWDAATHTASELPNPDRGYSIHHPYSLGLIRRDADGEVVVADLQPVDGTLDAILLSYWYGTKQWVAKRLRCHQLMWEDTHGVLSHGGRLWWFDLAHGLLNCDPFADESDLKCIALPQGCDRPISGRKADESSLKEINRCRCIKVSASKLRFVHIHDIHGLATLTMWTLEAENNGAEPRWLHTFDVPISEIWATCELPVISLVHPNNPDIIYLSSTSRVLAVDAPARNILEVQDFPMASSFRTMHAWVLTPALRQHLQGAASMNPSIFLSGMPMLSRPLKSYSASADELCLEECYFPLDILLEIAQRSHLCSVVKFAVTCKLLRRNIICDNFIQCLAQSSTFGASVFMGHFECYWEPINSQPHFVCTPLPNAGGLPAMTHASLMEEYTTGSLSECSAMGTQNGFVVLRDRLDPELCIWFPLTKFLCFLPPIATAYRSACILSTNMNGSFQLMLVKHRPHRSVIRSQTFVSANHVYSVLSRQKRPPVAGEWGSIVERLILGPRARVAKPNAFPVVIGQVAYWLCKSSGEYCILKMPLNNLEDPSYTPVPAQCSLTSHFHRDHVLIVPASLDGRLGLLAGPSSSNGLLGFVAVDTDRIMFWTVNGTTDWTWRATVRRDWITSSLGIARHVELALEWCAPGSGVISLTIQGTGRVILNLNTREVGRVFRPQSALQYNGTRLRGMCPYEIDWVGLISNMKVL